MALRAKHSLPYLSTDFSLMQQSANAPLKKPPGAPFPPDSDVQTTYLFSEDKHDENIAPNLPPNCRPMILAQKDDENTPVTKVKKMYYEDAFSVRGSHNSPKDRMTFESVVVVEIKTNTRVKDDMTKVLSDLSHVFAEMYQRSETSIMLTIDENANLLFCTTTSPAYLLKISAMSSLIGHLTNIRHTTLIQGHMQDMFGITPDKGVVIFSPVEDENLATGGTTARGGYELLGRVERSPSIFSTITRSMSRRLKSHNDNSRPLSLASVISPEITTANPRSPIPPGSTAISPFNLSPPVDLGLARPTNPSSSGEGPSTGDVPNLISSNDQSTDSDLKKKKALKDIVRRVICRDEKLYALRRQRETQGGRKD